MKLIFITNTYSKIYYPQIIYNIIVTYMQPLLQQKQTNKCFVDLQDLSTKSKRKINISHASWKPLKQQLRIILLF
jgi:hypothetical protein